MPKYNFLILSGSHHGIRLEDIALICCAVILMFSRLTITKYQAIFFISLIFYTTTATMISVLRELPVFFIMLSRLFEYAVIFCLFSILFRSDHNRHRVAKLLSWYILGNAFVVGLQMYHVLPGFSSKGIGYLNSRYFGVAGGPWELGVSLSLAFILWRDCVEKKGINEIVLLMLVFGMLFLSSTRGNILGFALALFFIYPRTMMLSTIAIVLTYSLFFDISIVGFSGPIERINLTIQNAWTMVGLLSDHSSDLEAILGTDPAMGSRWHTWTYVWNVCQPLSSIWVFLFGSGWAGVLFTESLWLHIFLSFGFLGLLFFLGLSTMIGLPGFIFVLLSGITLDLSVSIRMMVLIIGLWCLRNIKIQAQQPQMEGM
ncbi:MAG: hypothetical protein CMF42_01730 [Legionellales bacterium]|nr:hypothetical protein [Legionellales bacterium]